MFIQYVTKSYNFRAEIQGTGSQSEMTLL